MQRCSSRYSCGNLAIANRTVNVLMNILRNISNYHFYLSGHHFKFQVGLINIIDTTDFRNLRCRIKCGALRCRRPGCWKKTYMFTFINSIIWISGLSYLMVWMVAIIGQLVICKHLSSARWKWPIDTQENRHIFGVLWSNLFIRGCLHWAKVK